MIIPLKGYSIRGVFWNMIDCEPLESRRLLAANPVLALSAKGTLIVQGTSLADSINVSIPHNKIANGFVATVKNRNGTFKFSAKFNSVKRISVDGGAGADSILIEGGKLVTQPATLLGGPGNDRINYSAIAPILADGGTGDDTVGATAAIAVTSKKNSEVINTLFATKNSTGVNRILGGEGNDTVSGDTNDRVDGGPGIDTAFLAVATSDPSVDAARMNALAALYYQRLGATHVEKFLGINLLLSK